MAAAAPAQTQCDDALFPGEPWRDERRFGCLLQATATTAKLWYMGVDMAAVGVPSCRSLASDHTNTQAGSCWVLHPDFSSN